MDYSAKGLRVLVIAGAAGIGRAIARTFVEHGASAHICDVDAAALARFRSEMPGVGQTLADVSKLADVERLFEDAKRSLGGLDVLVNNAGIAGPTAKVEDIRPEEWDQCIAVDLNGMFYCTRKAMPLIKAARGGSIINLSSIAGRFGFPMRTAEVLARMVEGVSLKTTVTAQDVANTALFLASDAGRHISGQALSVCGGVRYLV